ADAARYEAAVRLCLEDPGVDGVLAILTPQAMTDADAAAQAVLSAASRSTKPVISCWMGEASVKEARARMRAAHLPTYRLPETAVEAFAYLAQFYRNQQTLLEAPGPLVHRQAPDIGAARAIVQRALGEGRSVLGATESKQFLDAFRIPVVKSRDASSAEEAAAAARECGFPVVMKIRSPDITHKSDVGGVVLGLPDAEAVRTAYERMTQAVRARRPESRIEGVSVERMASSAHGRELMAGFATDDVFGPAITFGAGGIAVEVLRDRAVALPPLNHSLVEEMIAGTRVGRMLETFRHLPAVDRKALEDVLLRVSEMACEFPEVVELDINPLLADEHGALALDARVVLRRPRAGLARYGHLAIHPYPAELVATVQLDRGEPVTIRPIRPEDARIETEFVEGLSAESRRLRFLSGLRHLTPAMLARFTQIDYDREMALIAVDESAGREREVAVARYIRLPDERSCEFAIVVADEWQGRGLGVRLMQRLIAVARSRGLETMVGWVAAANPGMLHMLALLGFALEIDPEDPHVRRATLALQ
ncbi:MAG TPA: GNAT family N-acetyltransferase, partial [Usitatibacter sp.]|nr:GNAT family N-acetyltransferase [Usitatibacter sp.]